MARRRRGFLRWQHRTSLLNQAVPSGLAVLPAVQTARAAARLRTPVQPVQQRERNDRAQRVRR